MSQKLTSVSDRLRLLQATIYDRLISNGHVIMTPTETKAFLRLLGKAVGDAKRLEAAYSQSEWNSRAYLDMLVQQLGEASEVLKLFKPDDLPAPENKILPFPSCAPAPPVPAGGDVA